MDSLEIVGGIIIPFLGTTLGAAGVFFFKRELSDLLQRSLLGFASGVMVAAAVWSLLLPAIEMAKPMGRLSFIPASVGLGLGVGFLLVLDKTIPHLHLHAKKPEGKPGSLKKTTMLVLAVTLHNIPEGMAVGVVFAGLLSNQSNVTLAGAYALAIGIAVQNFPEGAVISLPLKNEGESRTKAFFHGTLSGIVEPIASVLTILLSKFVVPALPYLLSFAAGAMLYVVVEELIPEASEGKHSNVGAIGFALGFTIMMILDVALG